MRFTPFIEVLKRKKWLQLECSIEQRE